MSINILSKKKKTKEDYFSLMNFIRNILDFESVLYHYDLEYSNLKDFPMDFYKFLDVNHFFTIDQKSTLLNLLRDDSLYNISDFMDVLVKDYSSDYSDVSTLNIKQFESILCLFFEKHQKFGDSIFEDIIADITSVNWEYLFSIVPEIEYEEPPIQNDEYNIKLKDLNAMKNAIEDLDNLIGEEDKILKDINDSLKKITERIV